MPAFVKLGLVVVAIIVVVTWSHGGSDTATPQPPPGDTATASPEPTDGVIFTVSVKSAVANREIVVSGSAGAVTEAKSEVSRIQGSGFVPQGESVAIHDGDTHTMSLLCSAQSGELTLVLYGEGSASSCSDLQQLITNDGVIATPTPSS